MTKADKMLNDLGYEIETSTNGDLWYEKHWTETDCVETIVIIMDKQELEISNDKNLVTCFDLGMLKAINEKIKELGWIE